MSQLSIIMFSLFAIVLMHSHAEIIVTTIDAPTPAPQPNLPMNGSTEGSLQPEECGPRCAYRYSNTQYKKPCLFFCQKCCAKCLCVPRGTYGNKEACPCYNNWKTKRGGPKCP
ncbi:gibberellin-regulated protein [Trifolium repens]|nr:gibberellin-regulated protein [Trifolium repens]